MRSGEQLYFPAAIDADTELARLRLLEAGRDPGTISRLDRLGISPGWRCLEVGAGAGSIVRWLAERVAPTGSVLATDLNPRFLTDMPAGVDVRRLDILHDDIEADTYDLVHCRAVLMHVPDPVTAIARMISALRPGGLFLFEEGDYGLWNYGGHPDAPRMNELATHLLTELERTGIANPWFGRELPGLVLAAGLDMHGGDVETSIARPGEACYEFERASAVAIAPVMIDLGIYGEADANLMKSVGDHHDSVVSTISLISVWGQKPHHDRIVQ